MTIDGGDIMIADFTRSIIRRSRLIMPVNVKEFVNKAYLRNADAVVLDLEDSVPASQKLTSRELIKDYIHIAAKGGSDTLVRVNHTEQLLMGDIEATIWPGLAGIMLPKVESAKQVMAVDQVITKLEQQRGLPIGKITIGVIVETAKGYLKLEEIAQASDRIDSITLGNEDFSLDTGIELSEETYYGLLIPRIQVVLVARSIGRIPMGLMGSLANFRDYDSYENNAKLAYKHGYLGASCIHPRNVEILNRSFSPAQKDIEHSLEIKELFEKGIKEGRASVALNGKMIDYVHFEKANRIIERAAMIEELEMKKRIARESVMKMEG